MTLSGRAAQLPAEVMEFIERLSQLRNQKGGGMAILRRNAGNSLAEARGALTIFYRLLPPGVRWHEEIYFLVATLFAVNDGQSGTGDFGQTMRLLRVAAPSADALDRRMSVLLDSRFEGRDGRPGGGELAYRLRQLMRLIRSKRLGVNWGLLLLDLMHWSDSSRWVQKKWASAYFQGANEPAAPAPQEEVGSDVG